MYKSTGYIRTSNKKHCHDDHTIKVVMRNSCLVKGADNSIQQWYAHYPPPPPPSLRSTFPGFASHLWNCRVLGVPGNQKIAQRTITSVPVSAHTTANRQTRRCMGCNSRLTRTTNHSFHVVHEFEICSEKKVCKGFGRSCCGNIAPSEWGWIWRS